MWSRRKVVESEKPKRKPVEELNGMEHLERIIQSATYMADMYEPKRGLYRRVGELCRAVAHDLIDVQAKLVAEKEGWRGV